MVKWCNFKKYWEAEFEDLTEQEQKEIDDIDTTYERLNEIWYTADNRIKKKMGKNWKKEMV